MSYGACCVFPYGCADNIADFDCLPVDENGIWRQWRFFENQTCNQVVGTWYGCEDRDYHPCCKGYECFITNRATCAREHGVFFGGMVPVCNPGPCGSDPSIRVCCKDGICYEIAAPGCLAIGGEPLTNFVSCGGSNSLCRKSFCCTCEQCVRVLERECKGEYTRINPVPCFSSNDLCTKPTYQGLTEFEQGLISQGCGFARLQPTLRASVLRFHTVTTRTIKSRLSGSTTVCGFAAGYLRQRKTRERWKPYLCNNWYRTQATKPPEKRQFWRPSRIKEFANKKFGWALKFRLACPYKPEA